MQGKLFDLWGGWLLDAQQFGHSCSCFLLRHAAPLSKQKKKELEDMQMACS